MPTPTPHAQHAVERKAALDDAAQAVIHDGGLTATLSPATVQAVVRALSYGARTLDIEATIRARQERQKRETT